MFIQKLYSLVSTKLYWIILSIIGAAMLCVALYYQHALGDEPCEVCIHIRIWVSAFTLLSILMLILPSKKTISIIGHLFNLVMVTGLLERCLYISRVEKGLVTDICSFYLNFPNWFALDKWFPAIFEVRNLCSFSPELILGITMTDGLIVIATVLTICSLAALSLMLLYKPLKAS